MTKLVFSAVLGAALLAVSATSFAADLAQDKDMVCSVFYGNASGLQELHGDKTMAVKQSQYLARVDKLKVKTGATPDTWTAALTSAKEADRAAFTLQLGEINAKHAGSTQAEVGALLMKFIKQREAKLGCNQA